MIRRFLNKLFVRIAKALKPSTELQYYHDTTVGLWCIDQDPKDVNIEWIRTNAFQLKPIDSDS